MQGFTRYSAGLTVSRSTHFAARPSHPRSGGRQAVAQHNPRRPLRCGWGCPVAEGGGQVPRDRAETALGLVQPPPGDSVGFSDMNENATIGCDSVHGGCLRVVV